MKFLLLAATLANAGSWFDGNGAAPVPPPPPSAPASIAVKAKNLEYVPSDLKAASKRVGNAYMRSQIASRDAGPFTFGVLGDSEPGRFWWQRLFNPGENAFIDQWRTLQASGIDFTLQLGDFVSEGNVANYREHVDLIDREWTKPILRCLGNHDRSAPNDEADKSLYDAVFGPRDYYFDHAGWRFVSLDSSDRKVTASQLVWLKRVLAVPGPKVLFTHVPPAYLKNRPIMPALRKLAVSAEPIAHPAGLGGYLKDLITNYFKDGASEFEEIVSNGGVKAVYMGHIHAFWAADYRGVRYVISGGGGSPLYRPLPPGYPQHHFAHTLRVRVGSSGLVETALPYKGTAFSLPPIKL